VYSTMEPAWLLRLAAPNHPPHNVRYCFNDVSHICLLFTRHVGCWRVIKTACSAFHNSSRKK
jgi:hypothetical protein